MADPGALSSWNLTEAVFSLNDEVPKPRPRAWERAPKSPVLARHHGRKVWKRYEAPQKAEAKDKAGDAEVARQALGDATNTSRPVKRLRLKDAPKYENDGQGNKAAQYFTTLRDKENASTPRRKQASRKSLKPDNARVRTRGADDNTPRVTDDPDPNVQDDPLRARESPALEDVRELLSSGNDAADAEEIAATSPSRRSDEVLEDETFAETEEATSSEMTTSIDQATSADEASSLSEAVITSENVPIADETVKLVTEAIFEDADNILTVSDATQAARSTASSPSCHEESINTERAMIVEGDDTPSSSGTRFSNVSEALPNGIADIPLLRSNVSPKALTEERLAFEQPDFDLSLTQSAHAKTPQRRSPRKKPTLLSPHTVTPPDASRTPKLLLSVKSLQANYPDETPQIGTSLLRRESLRGKESPSKKKDARKSKTPKKRDTLQRRDTLQEREILQRVIAETNAVYSDENQDAPPTEIGTLPTSSAAVGAEKNTEYHPRGSLAAVLCEEQLDMNTSTSAEAVLPAINENNVKKDLHRAREAIEVYEHPGIVNASQARLDITPDDTGMEAMDKANEVLAKTELDDVLQIVEATKEQTLNQRTRSGARFSDDTSLLKDFLNRAQARKAAQKPFLSASDAPIPQLSPRRSPRKTHGSQDGHVSSPRKSRSIGTRPGTPPGKMKMEALDSDDGEVVTAEPASCRRSTRTRLPALSKTTPGAPSFIPVRRADGADPVVLQKSQAQELALTTRANTRRNKGQAKPPLQALQDLPMESAEGATGARSGAERGKSVAWAAKIASYQDAKDEADDAEDRRPKVRRLRGLGAVNGTPAAKRTTAVVSTSNGTPAAKRRGRL